ncbi:protein IQ-DOMAIN 1 [Cucumis melo var. makuwa]|nr:protein IQ-DOMAIN 9 [Cucumis melo]XP_008439777.1 protein IQ-DOMAIN 9 [Cucumis melo]XP_008439779.1 protein IQ-DOMAIN 9 [Cucumis melo]XP_050944541.1 protein IQ-DOMAIN 9 [Cucumis melo]XP_050944542.1 protein IQ-DOMAIN 9 [Cucumis melo]KAA0052641.1 protein IQ-DOMAIN 1 [Cucumis melo var. makuwa]TYK13185.1 protein IQ-DOMAIN 1 [Cucumis melo var. makuwa]
MGSGRWFKAVIRLKKVKTSSSKQTKEKLDDLQKDSPRFKNDGANGKSKSFGMPIEDVAAVRIQTAYRAYRARKNLRLLKGAFRLQNLTQGHSVRKHATSTLGYLHSWSHIQAQIRARRLCMVTEGRQRQKRLENQRKLEAKLHDIEVEWCGGADSMDGILSRIHDREEAAVKRERALAYAFSHQWRANSNEMYGLGKDELGKADWGWSWKERWIAARPWESRVPSQFVSPKKSTIRQSSKVSKRNSPSPKARGPVKPPSPNGKSSVKARRLSYPATEKTEKLPTQEKGVKESIKNDKNDKGNTKKEETTS